MTIVRVSSQFIIFPSLRFVAQGPMILVTNSPVVLPSQQGILYAPVFHWDSNDVAEFLQFVERYLVFLQYLVYPVGRSFYIWNSRPFMIFFFGAQCDHIVGLFIQMSVSRPDAPKA